MILPNKIKTLFKLFLKLKKKIETCIVLIKTYKKILIYAFHKLNKYILKIFLM
jgi:hypothetical protein